MNHFRTIVEVKEQQDKISYNSKLIFMGSCFANNIGSYFSEIGYQALVNPFGILYNPISIANAINRLISPTPYTMDDLISHNGLWQSFDHHGQFNSENQDKCLIAINESLKQGSDYLKQADYLFITFGTAWAYRLKSTNATVANCHKFPSSYFDRFLVKHSSITELYAGHESRVYGPSALGWGSVREELGRVGEGLRKDWGRVGEGLGKG